MPTPSPTPSVESPKQAAARGILLWITSRTELDTEDRLAALEALGALEDPLPSDVVLAPVDERPGSLDDARQLLEEATSGEAAPRVLTGMAVAVGYLRRRIDAR